MWEILAAIIGVTAGALMGYVVSRVCWARKVDDRLTKLETQIGMMLSHFGIGDGRGSN